jgi:serine kinase of HPr protein (carbohydrate metabolism regulator)
MMISSGSSLKRMRSADETTPVAVKDAAVRPEKGGRTIVVHGVLVQTSGLGVLMMGDSGTGKTACGLDLIDRGSLWIADDAVVLERRGDALYGRGHERTKKLIAVRGRGILDARSLLRAETLLEETQVHVIIQFIRCSPEQGAVRGGASRSFLEIAGIPLYCRRVAAGGGSGRMADEVIGIVNQSLAREKRGPAENGDDDEADACGNHYGTVRFR